MVQSQNSKTITEKIDKVQSELNKYGKLSYDVLRKIYFCKKLNKAMRLYEEEIEKVKKHIINSIEATEICKKLYKKD